MAGRVIPLDVLDIQVRYQDPHPHCCHSSSQLVNEHHTTVTIISGGVGEVGQNQKLFLNFCTFVKKGGGRVETETH